MRKPGTTTAILVAIDELRAEVRQLRAEVLQRRAQEARRELWAATLMDSTTIIDCGYHLSIRRIPFTNLVAIDGEDYGAVR